MSGQVSLIDGHIDNENRCACCHRIIPEGSHYCIICGDVPKRKKQRQIDRIRNMSIDELAEFMKLNSVDDAIWIDRHNWIPIDEIKQWLESEVTE